VREADNPSPDGAMQHLDEMTCLLYIERQLDRARAQEVSSHVQDCNVCRTLLRALERESRLLTRAMLEEEEALPARLAHFQERARRSLQWIWGVAFALAATGVYALYTGYVEPGQQQVEQAGFGGSSLLSLLIFQGAFWKGWQSMITLLEVLALVTVAGMVLVFFRRRLRRGSALALVLAGFCGVTLMMPAMAAATEFRKEHRPEVRKDETIKGDIYMTGERVLVDGVVDGDLYVTGKDIEINGHITGDVISAERMLLIRGQVDGNLRSAGNTVTVTGTVGKSITWFGDTVNIDATGKVGGTVTMFGQALNMDGHLGHDILFFGEHVSLAGALGGGVRAKADTFSIASTASVEGPIRYEGNNPPEVAAQAKLASPVDFHKMEHKSKYQEGHYYVWRVIWTAAFILLGMVLVLLAPKFGTETIRQAERYAAPIGLGVLVFFGVPIAAIIACVTVVGIPVGILAVAFWFLMLNCAELVVGGVVGNWILGTGKDTWDMIGRIALGFVLVRIVYTPLERLHVIGGLVACGIWMWGMGAISLALYKQVQPTPSTGLSSGPLASPPLVGGAQPA
jgi:cytoskeletal protein CcmA (bactofilin family)